MNHVCPGLGERPWGEGQGITHSDSTTSAGLTPNCIGQRDQHTHSQQQVSDNWQSTSQTGVGYLLPHPKQCWRHVHFATLAAHHTPTLLHTWHTTM